MERKYKVYMKDEFNRVKTVLSTKNYKEACNHEMMLQDKGFDAFVWEC